MNSSKYIKFRDYLKSELDRRIAMNSAYSMRAFARDLKMPVSRLSELLAGKAGVSLNRVKEVVDCLQLSEQESQFVKDIAFLEFSKSEVAKKKVHLRLLNLKNRSLAITAKDFEEISDWYCFAILEFISKVETKNNIIFLADQLGIKASLCQLAMDRLIRKGFVVEQDGYWKSAHKSISVIGESKESIQKFHTQFINESVKAFANSEFNEREFSSTFAMLTEDEIQYLRHKMRGTIEETFLEINQKRDQSQKNDEYKLYGLGVQLFPVKPIKNNFLNQNQNIKESLR